jgi:hypothetical protein
MKYINLTKIEAIWSPKPDLYTSNTPSESEVLTCVPNIDHAIKSSNFLVNSDYGKLQGTS